MGLELRSYELDEGLERKLKVALRGRSRGREWAERRRRRLGSSECQCPCQRVTCGLRASIYGSVWGQGHSSRVGFLLSPLQPGVPSVLEQGPERGSCIARQVQMVRPMQACPTPTHSSRLQTCPTPHPGLLQSPSQHPQAHTPPGPHSATLGLPGASPPPSVHSIQLALDAATPCALSHSRSHSPLTLAPHAQPPC